MAETRMWKGGCHCGAVAYEVESDLQQVITCNCSLCRMRGTMLSFVPATRFTLLQGEDRLTEYRFNKRVLQHLFCATCGIASFTRGQMPDGTPMTAINVRCLEGVDPDALSPVKFDGASH